MNNLNKKLISFEGIDGSGKTTQIDLLSKYLTANEIKYKILREPGSSNIGEKIRDILLDKKNDNMSNKTELFLYYSARAQLIEEEIIPYLTNGYLVILDRFFDSTTAYQGYGRRIDLKLIEILNEFITYNKKIYPNLTFYLDIDYNSAQIRQFDMKKNKDRIENLENKFFEDVIMGYRKIASKEKNRFFTLQGIEGPQKIFNIILNKLKEREVI